MEQRSGLDTAFVYQENRRSPMHVTAVLIYDIGAEESGAISRDDLRELCAQRLAGFPAQAARGSHGHGHAWDLWSRANINFLGRQIKSVDTVRSLLPGLFKARESRKEFSDLPPLQRGAL